MFGLPWVRLVLGDPTRPGSCPLFSVAPGAVPGSLLLPPLLRRLETRAPAAASITPAGTAPRASSQPADSCGSFLPRPGTQEHVLLGPSGWIQARGARGVVR